MSSKHTSQASHRVPAHLRPFVVEQNYARYTPIDQAVWRYVLRQNVAFFAEKGYGSYVDGLRVTGMTTERIPSMEQMNEALDTLDMAVVSVNGFVPAVEFFDFQAHGILPIACDIRTLQHIAYTPAPDILHEAAGHAPMVHDAGYRDFIRAIGKIGSRALASKQDIAVYEAIRVLSIVKEDPHATEEQVRAAEADLEQALAANQVPSEATRFGRLYWWTVEYGLIGTLDDPKIYGAGLLSSVGESRALFEPGVQKLPFDWQVCADTDYDITKPQPQLFVCESFEQLIEGMQAFAKTMAQSVGGTESLHKAVDTGTIATAVYSSGLQVSGVFTGLELDAAGEAVYLKTAGPTALAVADQELPGHDKGYHCHGFGAPIGNLRGFDTPLEDFSDLLLGEAGVRITERATLEFTSGVVVEGDVQKVQREGGKIVLIVFTDCTVRYGDKLLFAPEWGTFDMAVGSRIVSVFAGAADREAFHALNFPPSKTLPPAPAWSGERRRLHRLYQQVRDLREQQAGADQLRTELTAIIAVLREDYADDWLLRLESLELLCAHDLLHTEQAMLRQELAAIAERDAERGQLIQNGLNLLI